VVDIRVRRSSIDDDMRLDLVDHNVDMLRLGDITDVVRDIIKAICKRRSAHDCDFGAGWLGEKLLHDVMAKETTSADDKSSADENSRGSGINR